MRILIGESGVVAGMNDIEFLWVQPVHAFDWDGSEASGTARFHALRVALGHKPTVGD